MNDLLRKITLKTSFNSECIVQEDDYDSAVGFAKLTQRVLNLREEGVRKSLIKLGWTPPFKEVCHECGESNETKLVTVGGRLTCKDCVEFLGYEL